MDNQITLTDKDVNPSRGWARRAGGVRVRGGLRTRGGGRIGRARGTGRGRGAARGHGSVLHTAHGSFLLGCFNGDDESIEAMDYEQPLEAHLHSPKKPRLYAPSFQCEMRRMKIPWMSGQGVTKMPYIKDVKSEPALAEPEMALVEAEVVLEEPEPISVESESVLVKPEPTSPEPEPMSAEPELVFAETMPTSIESDPKSAESESISTEPELLFADTMPTSIESEPKSAEPETTSAESEPTSAEPELSKIDSVSTVEPPTVMEEFELIFVNLNSASTVHELMSAESVLTSADPETMSVENESVSAETESITVVAPPTWQDLELVMDLESASTEQQQMTAESEPTLVREGLVLAESEPTSVDPLVVLEPASTETEQMVAETEQPSKLQFRFLGSEDEDSCDEADPLFLPRVHQLYIQDSEDDDLSAQSPGAEQSSPQSTSLVQDGESSSSPLGPSLFQFDWKPFPQPPIRPSERKEIFKSKYGPTTELLTPYDAFVAIWDRDFMEFIAIETNRYAYELVEKMRLENNLYQNSRITRWQDTNADELYVYFGLILAMGICVKSDLTEYWSKELFLATPAVGTYMSSARFALLSRCLHFNDNRTDLRTLTRPEAKLFKIAPIIKHLNQRFQTLYSPCRNIAVDESLTQWKGRLNINHHIKNKAARVGIKTYEVCEAQSGYLWRFMVTAGRENERNENIVGPALSATDSLVLELLKGLENKGHTIWMDNYYNSPILARVLKSLGFDCVGTLRTNRRFVPPQIAGLQKSNMTIGQISGCTSGDVDILVWRDHACLAMMSTYHGPGIYTANTGVTKPIVVHDYNVCMGGVDKKDQMLSMYPMERKRTRIWYKKFFRRLLNVSVLNAYILNRESASHTSRTRAIQHREFRKNLIDEILRKHSIKVAEVPKEIIESRFLPNADLKHFPEEYGISAHGNRKIRKRCAVCHNKTRRYCPACEVALCVEGCLKKYHTK